MKRVLLPYRNPKKLAAYENAVRAAGLEPMTVAAFGKVSLDGPAGLVLLGGTDVNPARYGRQAQAQSDTPDDERDAVELELLDKAIEKDLPVLAICRGLQILNVYHGGTLIQHLASALHDPDTEDYTAPAHEVLIGSGTQLAAIAGAERLQVNSRHHQAIEAAGAGLRISARAEDGVVEALERPDRTFVIAVQWHPEDQVFKAPEQLRLFERFANACR